MSSSRLSVPSVQHDEEQSTSADLPFIRCRNCPLLLWFHSSLLSEGPSCCSFTVKADLWSDGLEFSSESHSSSDTHTLTLPYKHYRDERVCVCVHVWAWGRPFFTFIANETPSVALTLKFMLFLQQLIMLGVWKKHLERHKTRREPRWTFSTPDFF